MHLNDISKVIKIVGDENRLKILCILFSEKNICVSDIAEKMNMSIAIISHHLQVLSKADILEPVRDGKRICYKLSTKPFVNDLKKFICKYK